MRDLKNRSGKTDTAEGEIVRFFVPSMIQAPNTLHAVESFASSLLPSKCPQCSSSTASRFNAVFLSKYLKSQAKSNIFPQTLELPEPQKTLYFYFHKPSRAATEASSCVKSL